MNIENINKLIKALRDDIYVARGLRFNMNYVLTNMSCHTAACIAGHAATMAAEEGTILPPRIDSYVIRQTIKNSVEWEARDWLGLDHPTARKLFFPDVPDSPYVMNDLSKEQAIRALEILRDTGRVDWWAACGFTPKQRDDALAKIAEAEAN